MSERPVNVHKQSRVGPLATPECHPDQGQKRSEINGINALLSDL
jgi:hypothetical protein